MSRKKCLISFSSFQVVHNYGHCGFGVMMSWGSAGTAAQLVEEAANGDMDNRHLAA